MKKILLIAVTLTCIMILYTKQTKNASHLQTDISEKILRLHIIANSDSEDDQNVKMLVKENLVTYLENLLKDSSSLEESIDITSKHYDDIINIANSTLTSNGKSYTAACCIERTVFPVKSYGDITLPSGEYTALRVTLGNASGKNWWCILYPPLCFVDASCGVVPDSSKEELKKILTADEYNSILSDNTDLEFRFKYLTFLN